MEKAYDDIMNIVVIAIIPILERGKTLFMFVNEADGALRFPGGKVKQRESLIEALQREIFEETGMKTITATTIMMIEHSLRYDLKNDEIKKSILLYFFLASFRETISMDEDPRYKWMDNDLVASRLKLIPYDNHLIINDLAKITKDHGYMVSPGFLDSPNGKEMIEIRYFCWIDPELQESSSWDAYLQQHDD